MLSQHRNNILLLPGHPTPPAATVTRAGRLFGFSGVGDRRRRRRRRRLQRRRHDARRRPRLRPAISVTSAATSERVIPPPTPPGPGTQPLVRPWDTIKVYYYIHVLYVYIHVCVHSRVSVCACAYFINRCSGGGGGDRRRIPILLPHHHCRRAIADMHAYFININTCAAILYGAPCRFSRILTS